MLPVTAQHYKRILDCMALAWEKIKFTIQSMATTECMVFPHYREVAKIVGYIIEVEDWLTYIKVCLCGTPIFWKSVEIFDNTMISMGFWLWPTSANEHILFSLLDCKLSQYRIHVPAILISSSVQHSLELSCWMDK